MHSVVPKTVQTGTMITVHGFFPSQPFGFDEVKSPVNEVPLISVKIANKASVNVDNKARDEPFGQSGSRCSIFESGEGEELPHGIYGSWRIKQVTKFLCQVQGQREGGRYNLSVALLGPAHDEKSEYGEALALDNLYQSNHLGDLYMITQMPVIYSIHPSATGTLGGAKLTIVGDSFSVEKDAIHVIIGDEACLIQTASLNEIVCTVGASSNIAEMHDGTFGIIGKHWGRRSPASVVSMITEGKALSDDQWTYRFAVGDFFETSPQLIQAGMREFAKEGVGTRSAATSEPSPRHWRARRLLAHVAEKHARHMKVSKDKRFHLRRDWDSGGHLSAIFVPPVTAMYTLIAVSIADSSVWVDGEKVLHVGNHDLDFRDPSKYLPKTAGRKQYSVAKRAVVERQRRSAKLHFENGAGYEMDAYFRGLHAWTDKQIHFGLGAVLHSTTVNERDTPSAIDERQFIAMHVDTNYTKLRIALKKESNAGKMSGKFTLALGGKESRTIDADASESEMADALRELFSDCSIQMAEPYTNTGMDGGGSSSDCAMGHGLEYRGLKATSLEGENCLPWDDVPADQLPFDPWLAMAAGLDGNLCRNPWQSFDEDTQPFCYVKSGAEAVKKPCVKQCETDQSSMVATFEGIHETASGTVGEGGERMAGLFPFVAHSGVTPRVTEKESFCGRRSLHFPNTFASLSLDRFWGSLRKNDGWKLSAYPYLCFAYKIRPGSEVSMLVNFRTGYGGPWTKRDRYIILNTYMQELTGRADTWFWQGTPENPGITPDNEWHHTCMNIRHLIEGAIAAGDRHFISGYDFEILDLKFYHPKVAKSSYADNPFWIDEFSISKSERIVKKTEYPPTPLQLVEVHKKGTGTKEDVEWLVTMSTAAEDCRRPEADLAIDASGLQGVESADIIEVEDHSPPLAGKLILSFGEDEVGVNLYSSSADMKASLSKMPSIGEVEVTQTGTCQTGYGWIVRFVSRPGDQPLMLASLQVASQDIERARVTVTEMEAGGVLLYPLPADSFRRKDPIEKSGVKLSVNGVTAECELRGICAFDYREDLTPYLESLSQVREDVGTYVLTLSGTRLESDSGSFAEVTVQGFPCNVIDSTTTRVTCRLMSPFLPQGFHAVSVKVPELGTAQHNSAAQLNFEYRLEISDVEPSEFDPTTSIMLTVHGAGLCVCVCERERVCVLCARV